MTCHKSKHIFKPTELKLVSSSTDLPITDVILQWLRKRQDELAANSCVKVHLVSIGLDSRDIEILVSNWKFSQDKPNIL